MTTYFSLTRMPTERYSFKELLSLDSRDAYLSTSPVKSKRRKDKTVRKALRLAANSIAVYSQTVKAH